MFDFIFTDFTWYVVGVVLAILCIFKIGKFLITDVKIAWINAVALVVFLALNFYFNDWFEGFIESAGMLWMTFVYFFICIGLTFFFTLLFCHFVYDFFLKEEPEPEPQPEPEATPEPEFDHEAELEDILKNRK